MQNYKEITLRYLKGQRNRTLLTIFGIILSVALITAIATIMVSTRAAMIKRAIREEGAFHGMFYNLDEDTFNKLKNHVEVDKLGITSIEGSVPIVETTEEERNEYGRDVSHRFIEIIAYDENSLDLLPINLKEGRLPKSSHEIIIEYWMAEFFDEEIEIGGKISLPFAKGHIGYDEEISDLEEREFTLVGFIEPGFVWKGNLITQGITGIDNEPIFDKYNVAFTLKDVKGAQNKISDMVSDLGIKEDSFQTNFRLLRLYAEHFNETFNKSIIGLLVFVVAIIIISTIAVIYNSFNISVLERVSQFGILRSVGATPRQIKGIVLREAAYLSIIGIPIGLFAGVFAMKVVLYVITLIQSDIYLFRDMEIIMSLPVFIISSIVGLITVFLSAIGPTNKAGKVSPLEAIRNTKDIKEAGLNRKRKTLLIRKLLGIEGEIAYKNLSRNKKRFIITVFSMVISIALFITFSTFSDLMFDMGAIDTNEVADFEIYAGIGELEEELNSRLRDIEGIEKIYTLKRFNGEVLLKDQQINDEFRALAPELFREKYEDLVKVPNVQISTVGNDTLAELEDTLINGNIDVDEMNEKNGVLVINNTFFYGNGRSSGVYEGYKLKVGDIVPFGSYEYWKIDSDIKYEDLTVVAVLEESTIGDEYNYNGSINIITTEEVFNKIYYQKDLSSDRMPASDMNIIMANNGDREEVRLLLNELEGSGLHYIDREVQAREHRNINIILSIFLYGFVSIIALISAINIVNTISTNILLRTKEIAMIKAVGMTQAGVKKMIAYEGIFYGIYASIFGGALGLGSSYVIFRLLLGISEFEYKMPWQNVALAIAGSMAITILAGVYPLRKLNKKIIVESMKAEN